MKQITFQEKTWTQSELNEDIDYLSSYLSKHRRSDSPFIFLNVSNHIKSIIAYFSIIRAGFVAVLIDPLTKNFEISEFITRTPPGLWITPNSGSLQFNPEKEVLAQFNAVPMIDEYLLSDACTIIYKSAENGISDPIILTKTNLTANAIDLKNSDEIGEESTCCSLLPLCHLFGLQSGVIAPAFNGASILIEDVSNLNSIQHSILSVGKHRVTNIYSIPAVYYLIQKIPEVKQYFSELRSIVVGGYKLPKSLYESFLSRVSRKLQEGYGLSEASPVCTGHGPSTPIKFGSVGKSIGNCKVKILDEFNHELPVMISGEICIKGSNVTKGYYKNPERTRNTIRDGWLHTGDYGYMDEEGYVYLKETRSGMLNVTGRNVYPAEVERFIRMNPNVRYVKITGEYIPIQGHIVKGDVELKEKGPAFEKSFQAWCLENISRYKLPGRFAFL